MNPELKRHLNEIAIKKERNAKKDAHIKNSSRTEQKQREESAPPEEPTSSSSDQESSSDDGSAISQEYADGMPAELFSMLGGSQDAGCEGATEQDDDESPPSLAIDGDAENENENDEPGPGNIHPLSH